MSQKDPGSFFRIAIKVGVCSGFQYEFTFDKKLEADDLKHENILIDKTSADLLKGSEVDFVSELIGDQFKISNPQSKSSCGCGVSVTIKTMVKKYGFSLKMIQQKKECYMILKSFILHTLHFQQHREYLMLKD